MANESIPNDQLPDALRDYVREQFDALTMDRDGQRDRADSLANLLYMIAEALHVPQEPHQTFSDRLLEAVERVAGHEHDRTGATPSNSHAPGCGTNWRT
ncbi:hypothetical protein [Arhodomonas sp. AD133]|uniref:hypothetical protein n=1 Tax=Arhodomonas sp. AD133 TaxID=3415009 RepID=UPI003EB91E01